VCSSDLEPIVAGTIDAQDSTEPTPRRPSVMIGEGQTLIYEVRVPTAHDLLYGEADGNGLRVRWLNRSGFPLAASLNPRWFVASTGDLAVSGGDEELQALTEIGPLFDVEFVCRGPCAAIAPDDNRYYLEIRNQSPSQQVFDLFVYTFDANDLNDRGDLSNQVASAATRFGVGDSPSGAIELVGDVDWYMYTGLSERVLRFSVNDEALGLVLMFEDGSTVEGTTEGLTTTVRRDERFRVYSVLSRAGPSGTSGYSISLP